VETPNSASPKYKWTCSVCGHEWQDDGVARKDDPCRAGRPTFPHKAAPLTKYILMYILSNGENHYGTDIRSRKGASAGREMG